MSIFPNYLITYMYILCRWLSLKLLHVVTFGYSSLSKVHTYMCVLTYTYIYNSYVHAHVYGNNIFLCAYVKALGHNIRPIYY